MSTPSNPGWATGYVPSAEEWIAVFSGKVDYPAPVGQGGTGLTATPVQGQLLIGTGSGFALNRITAGAGIGITNGPGTIVIRSTTGTGADAFNSYGLQWAIWFNSTPAANELLALYTSPILYQYPANFTNSYANPPLSLPAASFQMTVQQRLSGSEIWNTIGTISINTDGGVTFATISGIAKTIHAGDQLKILAPAAVDTTVAGFSATLKGIIAT